MVFKHKDKIVFFGDSLTWRGGVLASPYPARRFQFDYAGSYMDVLLQRIVVHFPELEIEAYNKGRGGNTVVDLLNRVKEDVLSLSPDWVVLFIGQNDCKKFTGQEFKKNLIKLLDIFKKNNIKVIQLSTTPANTNEEKNRVLLEYDEIIRDLCRQYNNIFVDVKSKFMKVMEYNKTAEHPVVLFNGGPHMSLLGNILIADTVFEALTKE